MKVGPKYQVRHRTTFVYSSAVTDSTNVIHLEPRTFPFQKTLQSTIEVRPDARIRRFQDLFDNVAHHFEIPQIHERLEIVSHLQVQHLLLEVPSVAREVGFEAYDDAETRERVWPFLQESRYVPRHPGMWRTALDVVRDRPTLFGMSEAIMCWIHREFRHDVGATQVNPQLEEAFVCRHGVCQDFAHIMLGLCRAVGIPARYASGYLYEGPRGAGTGAQGAHAWAEVHLPEVGWIGFDPSRGQLVDERYIKVATGRDYDDVAPVKGSYRGTGQCRMSVTVEVEKQAD